MAIFITPGGGGIPAGSEGDIQLNLSGAFGSVIDFKWLSGELQVPGDIKLDDGGTFTTTIQVVTPTQNNVISYPNATGTLALVAGSSGSLIQNLNGAYAGVSTLTADDSGNIALSGRLTNSTKGAQSLSPTQLTGAWYGTTGNNTPTATGSTAYPALYISPAGTSFGTDWSTGGTGLGVNASSGFGGNLLDLRVNGTSFFRVQSDGRIITDTTLGGGFSSDKGNLFGVYYVGGGYHLSNNSTTQPFVKVGGAGTGSIQIRDTGYLGWGASGQAGGTPTLTVYRDAANTLAQRNDINAQTFRLYNTYTDANNYERHTHSWSGNVLNIANEAAGSGTLRSIAFSANGAASTPPITLTGTWFTGGLAATTKPHFLIEPTGTTSAAWSTSGTGLGVNAASGFAGNLLDLQVNGTSRFLFTAGGLLTLGGRTSSFAISAGGDERFYYQNGNGWRLERFGGGATIGLESIYAGLFIGHQGSGAGGLAASSGGAGTAIDTFLIRDRQANTWGQRNGTNAQTFRLYNTYTDTNNYERHTHSWSGDVLNIANEAAGSGTLRSIAFSANGATSTPPVTFTGTWFTGGLAATTKPQVLIEPTGTTSAAWSTSGTGLGVNAASGFAGNLLDLQVNGTSVASVNANGRISTAGGGAGGLSSPSWIDIFVTGGANPFYRLSNGSLRVAQAASNGSPSIELCGGWANSSGDVVITRDAANTLAQRRSTNAQTFRCYGTYTDASNYVRAALSSTSTAVTLAAETEGTGADDISLNLTAAGTGTVKINSVAEVAASSIVTGLPTAPTVGMIARVTDATTPTVGSTVTGGGAAAALVWYNGTSWTILGV